MVAIDVFEHPDRGYLVNEVNYTMEFRNSIDTTGVNIPARVVDYVVAVGRGDIRAATGHGCRIGRSPDAERERCTRFRRAGGHVMARLSKRYRPSGAFAPEHLPPPDIEPQPDALTTPHDMSVNAPDSADAATRHAIAESVWQSFAQMTGYAAKDAEARPVALVRGEGSRIWDAEGREYLDALAGLAGVNVGYGRTEITDAMRAQFERIHFVSHPALPNVPGTVLAERLARLSPTGEGSRVFFVASRSEATETALKLAKAYHRARGFAGRYKTVSRRNADHGITAGALAVSGIAQAKNPYEPLVPGALHVTPPDHLYCPCCASAEGCTLACADEIRRVIAAEGPETVAAVVLEPVQRVGCLVPPPGYYERVRAACDEYGVLLIMDEAICGFGRIGTLFGSEAFELRPDILTVAEGLTSAYAPFGAVIASRTVVDTLADNGDDTSAGGIPFGGFGGSLIAAAAALANLDILEREDLPGRARDMGAYFLRELQTAVGQHPQVGEIRGRGLLVGIELVRDRETREPLADAALLAWLADEFPRRGLICRADDHTAMLLLAPPLNIAREEIDRIVTVVTETLSALTAKAGDGQ